MLTSLHLEMEADSASEALWVFVSLEDGECSQSVTLELYWCFDFIGSFADYLLDICHRHYAVMRLMRFSRQSCKTEELLDEMARCSHIENDMQGDNCGVGVLPTFCDV